MKLFTDDSKKIQKIFSQTCLFYIQHNQLKPHIITIIETVTMFDYGGMI